eukprot:TRINITY_DN1105_c0_g1_i2.p1 TRINITY_DN1105_c0_g1~~TRINITY_DN1105_c0_g1_i2.p1  ORF type:complete len:332 (+),score=71.26 TRINITY_DN1105_c0_g1_i2:39-998(+)
MSSHLLVGISATEKEGFLQKLDLTMKNWCQRWFFLVGHTLFYRDDQANEYELLGELPLTAALIRPANLVDHPNSFEVFVTDPARRFFLQASSKEDMDNWMETLKSKSKLQPWCERKAGYVEKQGTLIRTLAERYLLLEDNLYIFKTSTDAVPEAKIDLSDATIEQTADEHANAGFRVVTPTLAYTLFGRSGTLPKGGSFVGSIANFFVRSASKVIPELAKKPSFMKQSSRMGSKSVLDRAKEDEDAPTHTITAWRSDTARQADVGEWMAAIWATIRTRRGLPLTAPPPFLQRRAWSTEDGVQEIIEEGTESTESAAVSA